MQPNIAMNFAEYVAWKNILLRKHCQFGEKI